MIHINNLFGTPKPKFANSTEAIKDYFKRNKRLTQLECCQLFLNWNLHKVVERLNRVHKMNITKETKTVKTKYGYTTDITVYINND